uniref:Replication factor A C-terminal domain-containing protein n=1 Tax=Lactuca sativa TaxID=4236 RepID=A0A9R1XDC9_LACSA|nr:hypothetical protein LSAT_V11C500248600 [Lactuca sativa]
MHDIQICSRLSVSNWYSVTKLYINANIEEILQFKNTLVSKNSFENLSANRSKGSSSLLYSETDEFLLKHDFKPITEIEEIRKVSRVIVLGTVKRVCTNFSWYYWGCKSCHKKVDEDIMMNTELNDGSNGKKMVVCSSSICNNKVVSVLPRY